MKKYFFALGFSLISSVLSANTSEATHEEVAVKTMRTYFGAVNLQKSLAAIVTEADAGEEETELIETFAAINTYLAAIASDNTAAIKDFQNEELLTQTSVSTLAKLTTTKLRVVRLNLLLIRTGRLTDGLKAKIEAFVAAIDKHLVLPESNG